MESWLRTLWIFLDWRSCESIMIQTFCLSCWNLPIFRQWRHKHMAMRFLMMLIRHDYPFPTVGVELIVNGLINDALIIRKVGLRLYWTSFSVVIILLCVVVCCWTCHGASTAKEDTRKSPCKCGKRRWVCLFRSDASTLYRCFTLWVSIIYFDWWPQCGVC